MVLSGFERVYTVALPAASVVLKHTRFPVSDSLLKVILLPSVYAVCVVANCAAPQVSSVIVVYSQVLLCSLSVALMVNDRAACGPLNR